MIGLSAKSRRLLLIFLTVSSFLLVFLILADWLPYLRGPAPETSEWYWPYALRPVVRWWPAVLGAGFFWLVAAWWLAPEKTNCQRNIFGLAGLIIASLSLQLAIIYADRPDVSAELVDRTLSNLASGFFEPAAEIEELQATLRTYPQQMARFTSEHAQTHPPGLIIANWLTIQALARWPAFSEVIAVTVRPLRCTDLWLINRPPQVAAALAIWSLLPSFAAALTVVPAYSLAKQLLQGRARRLAAVLVASMPALLLFTPKSVQLYAFLTLLLFWAFQSAFDKQSNWRFVMTGMILSLMTYLSLGNAVLFILLVLYAIFLTWLGSQEKLVSRKPDIWGSLLQQLLMLSIGAATIWLLTWAVWGVSPWAIAQVGIQRHYDLVTNLRRYDWWTIWNLIDLILFSGWPIILGFIGSIVLTVILKRKKGLAAVDILPFCLLILIIILDVSGTARGEVGRIWLFFMPLLAYPAAHFWNISLPKKHHTWILVAMQLLLLISLGLAWRPVRAVIVVAQEPPMASILPRNSFDGGFIDQPFALIGYTIEPSKVQAGSKLELTLFWETQGPAQRPFTVFNHLLDEDGNIVAQQDNWPVNGRWPPTCWQAGDRIVDTYHIDLPADLPSQTYHLYTGLYDSQSGERVTWVDGSDALQLGTVFVQEP